MLFGSYMKVKNEGGVWKPEGLFRRWVLALVLPWGENKYGGVLSSISRGNGSLPRGKPMPWQVWWHGTVLGAGYSEQVPQLHYSVLIWDSVAARALLEAMKTLAEWLTPVCTNHLVLPSLHCCMFVLLPMEMEIIILLCTLDVYYKKQEK